MFGVSFRQKLSDLYWINVNDPHFPFVAFIEHKILRAVKAMVVKQLYIFLNIYPKQMSFLI